MENNNKKQVVTRFAPSPTGFLHIGGVRTAIYAWLWARKNNGKFILRIEDTDKEREVPGSIEHIIKSLKWIGLDWDYGPDKDSSSFSCIQSERLDIYKKYADKLVEKGLAYADPYTEEELEAFRVKADEEKKPFLYRNHRPENPPVWDGTKPLRLKINNVKNSEWEDMTRGILKAGAEALDDFILIKSDGYPTYNFAHIIDDYEMGVTHIMRADEFIASTPKFLALYEALDIERPEFVTLPPILGRDGNKKLGKRDGAKDFLEYSKDGYLSEAMFNFLVFIGWNPGGEQEIMTKGEIVNAFDVKQIHISGGRFNEEKLDWINHEHLKLLSDEEQQNYIISFIPENIKNLQNYNLEVIRKITPIIIERIKKGIDIVEMVENKEINYYFTEPDYNKDSLFFKSSKISGDKYNILASYLKKTAELLSSLKSNNFNKEEVKKIIWPFAEGVGKGDILWPMRYAFSGVEKSPDPFYLAEILGKEESIKRIRRAITILES